MRYLPLLWFMISIVEPAILRRMSPIKVFWDIPTIYYEFFKKKNLEQSYDVISFISSDEAMIEKLF
jgi:hypothetical protein